MNLKKIKEILNLPVSDSIKKSLVFEEIAKDKNAIPDLLIILENERKQSEELITDMNLELSRTTVILKGEMQDQKDFALEKVGEFYKKWKDKVTHCFNMFVQK